VGTCLRATAGKHVPTGASRATVSKVVSIHETLKANIREEEQWVKINTNRKRSSYIEKDCFKK
jgi:hypothetical protein